MTLTSEQVAELDGRMQRLADWTDGSYDLPERVRQVIAGLRLAEEFIKRQEMDYRYREFIQEQEEGDTHA